MCYVYTGGANTGHDHAASQHPGVPSELLAASWESAFRPTSTTGKRIQNRRHAQEEKRHWTLASVQYNGDYDVHHATVATDEEYEIEVPG